MTAQKKATETVPIPQDKDVYGACYQVTVKVRDRICGGIPKDPKVQLKWLETKGFTSQEAEAYTREMREDLGDDFVEDQASKTACGFKSDGKGLFIEARQIEAMLREGATELGLTKSVRGFRQRLQHGCFVRPARLYFGRKAPDGQGLACVHAITPKGKIAAFSQFDFINHPTLTFQVMVVRDSDITAARLAQMLALGQEQGLGARRSQGEGKLEVLEIVKEWGGKAPEPNGDDKKDGGKKK